MILNDLKLPPGYSEEDLLQLIKKKMRPSKEPVRSVEILKKSIDARKKPEVRVVLSVLVNEPHPLKQKCVPEPVFSEVEAPMKESFRTAVVGSGPAGLFAAIKLLRSGVSVTLYERGDALEERIPAVDRFFETGDLDPESNVQFGEGGAGTFSDGKLNTGTHHGLNADVFRLFYEFGAPEDVLYDAKPHVGTDALIGIVKRMREEILSLGGLIRFRSKLTDVERVNEGVRLTINGTETEQYRFLILSVGHSARDTFEMLQRRGFTLEQKPFAVGVRVEHLQEDISRNQYGGAWEQLPPASYKLTGKGTEERGVYSFCMCPGGYVVNASSEPGRLTVNGMSYRNRDGVNANSAIVVQVRTEDFPDGDPLSGVRFQRALEEKAYRAGGGKIPVQRFQDFVLGKKSVSFGKIRPETKGAFSFGDLNEVFPDYLSESLKTAIPAFGKSIPGFDDPDVLLSAVESRTSSPVRIVRNASGEAAGFPGVYPAGEGAGYAGGIVSSAADGLRSAGEIIEKIRSLIHG